MTEPTTDQMAGSIPPLARPVGAPDPSSESEPAAPARPAPAKPRIGDSRPAPQVPGGGGVTGRSTNSADGPSAPKKRRRGGRGRGGGGGPRPTNTSASAGTDAVVTQGGGSVVAPRRGTEVDRPSGGGRANATPAPRQRGPRPTDASANDDASSSRTSESKRRRGRERNGRPVGRYLMCVHVAPAMTQIAVLEGRSLIEHHVARLTDDANQIDGNIYRGRVKNVLPGMEAAFVDIGTPKNAVLYWGDVHAEREDAIERDPDARRIEHLLRPGQTIVCQVTKNPIGLKGARLTEEVSLPGRFVVLVPGSDASGISKRLDDRERKRLRGVLDDIRPAGHGIIVRTAAEGISADELRRDVEQLVEKWNEIDEKARRLAAPSLLYSEPHVALRAIREELSEEYRGVIIDDYELFELVRTYVGDIDPALADRVEYFDEAKEGLSIFDRHHVHEQLHKALDRKVWLPSGGSLIIERTEALTVIDVNTGKNVGSSNLEETVYRNNLEAADEIARQLRLRDIGGIIVIDFIDMEIKGNRAEVVGTLRDALSRDKTPTQVFDISELGLVEMTRKRVGEGLVESLSQTCEVCEGRGIVFPDLDV